jgi:hypothetical protein
LKRRLFKVSGISMLVVFAFAIVAGPAVAASYPGSNFQWQAGSVGSQSDLYGVTALDSAHAWAGRAGVDILLRRRFLDPSGGRDH